MWKSRSSNRLPFLAEYAKNGKASCTACKQKIPQNVLRIAKVVQSTFDEDLVTTNWFHVLCFFTRIKPKTTEEIKNFDTLRGDDQQKIREKISNVGGGVSSTIRTKRPNNGIDCFVKLHPCDSGDVTRGIKTPNKQDKKIAKTTSPKNRLDTQPSAKRIKIDVNTSSDEKLMNEQNEGLIDLMDHLTALSKNQLISLLNANDQTVPEENSRIIENLADLMCFGVPISCDKCKGNLKYKSGVGYKCTGNLDEWTKCENVDIDPPKKKFKVPNYMKEDNIFLATYTPKIEKRIFKKTSVQKEECHVDGSEIEKTLLSQAANATESIPAFISNQEILNYSHNSRVKKVTGVISATFNIKCFHHYFAKKRVTTFTVLLSNQKGGSIRVTFFEDDAWRYLEKLKVNMVITVDGGRIGNMVYNQNKFNEYQKSSKTAEIIFMDYSTLKIEKTKYFDEQSWIEKVEDVPTVSSIKEVKITDNKIIEFECSIKRIYTLKDGFIKEILAGDDTDEIYLEFPNQIKNQNQFKEGQLVIVQGSHCRKENTFTIKKIENSVGQ